MVSSTLRLHFTPGKDPVSILQEAGWASGPVWTGGKSRPHRDSIPDRPDRCQLLYRLSYRARNSITVELELCGLIWTMSHPDMRNVRIIGNLSLNKGYIDSCEVGKCLQKTVLCHISIYVHKTILHNSLYGSDIKRYRNLVNNTTDNYNDVY